MLRDRVRRRIRMIGIAQCASMISGVALGRDHRLRNAARRRPPGGRRILVLARHADDGRRIRLRSLQRPRPFEPEQSPHHRRRLRRVVHRRLVRGEEDPLWLCLANGFTPFVWWRIVVGALLYRAGAGASGIPSFQLASASSTSPSTCASSCCFAPGRGGTNDRRQQEPERGAAPERPANGLDLVERGERIAASLQNSIVDLYVEMLAALSYGLPAGMERESRGRPVRAHRGAACAPAPAKSCGRRTICRRRSAPSPGSACCAAATAAHRPRAQDAAGPVVSPPRSM